MILFLADEMLGKLARWLRMGGFDVFYQRQLEDEKLLKIMGEEGRFLLTRDHKILKKVAEADLLFIQSDYLFEQMEEFFSRFPDLKEAVRPFSRCVECNEVLISVSKEDVKEKVWPHVYQTQQNFTTCPACHRIYWKATHVERITDKLSRLGLDFPSS